MTVPLWRRPLARPLFATVLVVTTGALPVFLTGAVGVQMRASLKFDETGLGLAFTCFYLLSAVLSVAFGRAAERLGPVRSMRISGCASGVVMLMIATAATSATTLFGILMLGGVANAASQPAANLYIARVVPPRRQGIAFAIKQSAIPGATLLGGLAVPTIALTVGWRWAFVAGAGLAFCGALLTSDAGGTAVRTSQSGRRDQPLSALVLLGAGIGLGALAASGLGSFATSSFVEVGFSEAAAGWFAAIGSVAVIVNRLRLGRWADRRQRLDLLPTVAWMILLGAVGWLGLATMTPVGVLAGGLIAYAAGWGWPGLFNLAIAQANPNAPAAASGVTQTGTYLGAGFGPLIFGSLAEFTSYSWAWTAAAVAAGLSAACIIGGARRLTETVGNRCVAGVAG